MFAHISSAVLAEAQPGGPTFESSSEGEFSRSCARSIKLPILSTICFFQAEPVQYHHRWDGEHCVLLTLPGLHPT